jgi:AraC-like DNA-binding protein
MFIIKQTMIKGLQKSANNLQELQISHPGIIHTEDFNKHFELHCYEPSPDLKPFVTHIWVQRQKSLPDPLYKPPIEVLSGPNIYLFFTSQKAFIHDITRHEFQYNAFASPVVAGVKFRPGGFYPFLQGPVSTPKVNIPLASVFPDSDDTFTKTLLKQPDEVIVGKLETLLRNKQPKMNKKLELIDEIMHALDTNPALQTVESVARAFHTSSRTLQLLFQTYVGVSLKWILTRKRLLKTIRRVQEQSRPSWSKAAAEQGYSSQSHFTREFSEVIGQSPSQYLKQ